MKKTTALLAIEAHINRISALRDKYNEYLSVRSEIKKEMVTLRNIVNALIAGNGITLKNEFPDGENGLTEPGYELEYRMKLAFTFDKQEYSDLFNESCEFAKNMESRW
jgi:hypothetical protein